MGCNKMNICEFITQFKNLSIHIILPVMKNNYNF